VGVGFEGDSECVVYRPFPKKGKDRAPGDISGSEVCQQRRMGIPKYKLLSFDKDECAFT